MGTIYRNVPTKRDGDVHPLRYVFPHQGVTGTMDDEQVGDPTSVSVVRDTHRFDHFQRSTLGEIFNTKQKLMQRTNTFEYTRTYREDNLKDHIDPTVHKPRHGHEVSLATAATAVSIPGEFTFVPDDIGKMQAGV